MKINCYICTTVVSLPSFLPSHTFSSRDPLLPLHPFFQRNEKPLHPPPTRLEPPPFPPPLPPRHLFDSLSKVYTPSPPICLFRRFHPPRKIQRSTCTPTVVSLEQSIPISRESVLNLAPSRVSGSEHVSQGTEKFWMDLFMREFKGFNRDYCLF